MIWQEILLLVIIFLFIGWLFVKLWILTRQQSRLWLVCPDWSGDGRKFIIAAINEQEADQIFMRRVCGWTVVKEGERSNARISLLRADEYGVIIIP